MADVEVALRVTAPSSQVACRGSEISTRIAGGRVWVKLAKLDNYAAVLFESPR